MLTYLKYAHSLICNFLMMQFNILTFHSFSFLVRILCFFFVFFLMIILVEIDVSFFGNV